MSPIGRHPKRYQRLRHAAKTCMKIIKTDPETAGKAIGKLGMLAKQRQISTRDIYRIMSVPLATTTIKSKLEDFVANKITLNKLLETVNKAYERSVPQEKVSQLLNCRRGEFYKRTILIAMEYGAPRSFITNLTIKRMHAAKMPGRMITEANNMRWEMHRFSHEAYAAKRKGNNQLAREKTRAIRLLQNDFIERFTKKL